MTIISFTARRPITSDTPRHAIEAEIERLMVILDLQDGDPDDEPILGWSATYAIGSADDREDDAGDDREMDDDREWSLGSLETINQSGWSMGNSDGDREEDDDIEGSNFTESRAWQDAFEIEPRFLQFRRYRHDRDYVGVSTKGRE